MTHTQTPMGLLHTNGSSNLGQTTRPYYNWLKKKRTCRIEDFAVPADHRVKLKESENKGGYLDLEFELKKTVEQESSGYTNRHWCSWSSH